MTSYSVNPAGRRPRRRTTIAVVAGFLLAVAGGCSRSDTAAGSAGSGPAQREAAAEGPVHSRFTLTSEDLERLTEGLAPEVTHSILAAPHQFLDLVAQTLAAPAELTWLVDRRHPLDPEYEPADLVELDAHGTTLALSREGHRLRAHVVPDLLQMTEAARAEGVTLLVSSAYRSYLYQEELYAYWVEELGREEADRVSARPGTSQHQLGTTIDFGCICDAFAHTAAGGWMAANAWRFGFSLSYPEGYEAETGYAHESWHFRYIGKPAARLEREFFGGFQQYLLEFLNVRREELLDALVVV